MRVGLGQRLTAYTWLRDGEAFAQQLAGPAPYLNHGSRVPFSLELLEPDFVPLDYGDPCKGIRQRMRPPGTGYWVLGLQG